MTSEGVEAGPTRAAARTLVAVWLVLAALALAIAARDLSAPGLYYDEVIQAVPAQEFLDAHGRPSQMPGATSTSLFGRPFPLFTQAYMGALKSQLLIPCFALFGASSASLRATTLALGLLGLLAAMLLANDLLGRRAAILTGALLAFDPSFLFVSRHDWGSFALSLGLRCAGLFLFATGWRARAPLRCFAAGLCFGLALYNKIDAAVPLAAMGMALVLAAPRSVAHALRTQAMRLLAPAAGLVLGAAPMLWELGGALLATRGMLAAKASGSVMDEKLGALRSMLDGSYFDRLMRSGGSFERMFQVTDAAAGPFLPIYALAIIVVGVWIVRRARAGHWDAAAVFVLAAAVLSSLGMLATPRAVRIHHVLAAYPFPQLVVALALAKLAEGRSLPRLAALLAALLAIGGNLWTSLRTFDTIERSHGKGRWSDAISGLAGELAAEPGALVVSLDWGFHAQLRFLDRRLALREPIWRLVHKRPQEGAWRFAGDEHTTYLMWDRDFAVFPLGPAFLELARALDGERVTIRQHLDREGDGTFYSVRIAGGHEVLYRGPGGARPFEVILR